MDDVVYIGLAGANQDTDGTFEQRIRSHAGKLQRGRTELGCPQAWAGYHEVEGGPEALGRHALRLILMPSRTTEEKSSIKRLEDFLLLLWDVTRRRAVPDMPTLNSRRPDLAAVTALFEGAIEVNAESNPASEAAPIVPPLHADATRPEEAPVDPVDVLWPNEDDAMEQAERLERYQCFFRTRNLEDLWNSLSAVATQSGLSLRVAAMKSRTRADRPGELRVVTMLPGGQRAHQVHAIVIPDLDAQNTTVELRLTVEQLPDYLAIFAEPYTRGKMRSRLQLPTRRLLEVVTLFA